MRVNKTAVTSCAVLFLLGSTGAAQAQLLGLGGSPPQPPPSQPATAGAPPDSGSGRRVVYSNSAQRVWLVEANDQVVRTYPVSGRRGFPPPGNYHVFSKSRVSRAGPYRLDYMVRFYPGRGLAAGFHAIPVRQNGQAAQSEADLGQYRSRGCVRQRPSDAAFLWDWAPVGTTVVLIR